MYLLSLEWSSRLLFLRQVPGTICDTLYSMRVCSDLLVGSVVPALFGFRCSVALFWVLYRFWVILFTCSCIVVIQPCTILFKIYYESIHFCAQVMRVKLQPPSGTTLAAFNPILPPPMISQVLLLANPSKVSFCFVHVVTVSHLQGS